MAEMMKAVRLHAFGGPDVLRYEDAPRPEPARGEVLVRVHAASINPPDLYLRDGYRALPPEWQPASAFPLTLGTDISGEVAALGEETSGFHIGDHVYALVRFPADLATGSGAWAQYVCVPADELARAPQGLSHVEAAAAPMSLLTAWQFLVEAVQDMPNPFQAFQHVPADLAGKTVLVNGAGGGVGHFAVQVARWRGAKVIAVASGRHESLLRELGAEAFIDYTRQAADAVAGEVDGVIDAVGGTGIERFLKTIKRGGFLYLVNPLNFSGYEEAARRNITVSTIQVRSSGKQLAAVAPLLASKVLRVAIDSTYALSDAVAANERAARGSIQGKIVLVVE